MAITSSTPRRLGPGVTVALVLAGLGIATLRALESAPQADDFYYFDSAPLHLTRSETEVVVRFAAGSNAVTRLAQETPGLQARLHSVRDGRNLEVLSIPTDAVLPAGPDVNALLRTLQQDPSVEFVAPVFHYPATGIRILPTDEVIVRLKPGDTLQGPSAVIAGFGVEIDRLLSGTSDQYVLRLTDGKGANALDVSRALHESGRFLWAEPNLVQEYQKFDIPNDTLFANQWHLNNTGQGGGTVDADSDLVEAWNIQTGSSSIVIAVVDDGMEKTHEDLVDNLFFNPGETAGNGVDDDLNGRIDDVNGWDFSTGSVGDNDVTPDFAVDNHGTSVAGVAAARGNNAMGVTGACRTCKILPVRIFRNASAATADIVAALNYAALFADVINNSWGGGSPSAAVQTAIGNANTTGRGGKGAIVMFATGNSATGLTTHTFAGFTGGTHGFQWEYSKDAAGAGNDDTAWVAWVQFPGGEIVEFTSGLPAGWTTGGAAPWTVVTDTLRADEGVCLTKVAKAGTIGNSEVSTMQVLNKTVPAGNLVTYLWRSSGANDGLRVKLDINNDGIFETVGTLQTGLIANTQLTAYPARYPESIAVGASSNRDCRSSYSQYGPEVAFVAPSSAGPRNLGITTTDRTGGAGYDGSNYTAGFGGTSSATPLASGIAGLILSRSPGLTRAKVLDILKNSADKVGTEPYVGGRNDKYGHGRLNAHTALLNTPVVPGAPTNAVATPGNAQASVSFDAPASNGGSAITSYTVTSSPGGFTSSGPGSPRVVMGLTNGVSYTFTVTATNEAGTGPASAASNSVMPSAGGDPPGAFTKTSPANGAVAQPQTIQLVWGASSAATGYEYCIDTNNNSACDTGWVSAGASTNAIVGGLLAKTTYYWHVRSSNGGGMTYSDGGATAYRSFTTVKSKTVDLNGDGLGDVFTYSAATGAWSMQVSQAGGGFTTPGTGGWSPGWTVVPAHFNVDGQTDFFLSNAGTGQWFKMLNTGTGFTVDATSFWWPGWQKYVMELDGDGVSDLFLYDPLTGQWYKALSTPGGFTYLTGYWTTNWEITVMNLNRDAFSDLFLMNRSTGQWYWVLGEAGAGFTYPASAYWATDWAFYTGDFNGDGLGDLFLYRSAAGQHYVAFNNGAGFNYTAGYGWAAGWTPYVADLDGNGMDDLFLHNAGGQWYEMIGDGAGLFSSAGGQLWSTGWQLHTLDLNGDNRTDFVLYNPATGAWYQARNLILGSFTYNNGAWASGLTIIVKPPFS